MRVQIRTLQVPRKWGMTAFTPGLSGSSTASFNGQHLISGAPGTVRVPSPRPAALNDGELGGPLNQPSSVAPNWFLPCLYTFHANRSVHPPMEIFGDTLVPVPIPNPSRVSMQSQHKTRIGGRTATAALRPFTRWPTYGRGS